MNSESLYRYSKVKQHQPGFIVTAGNQPEVVYEYNHSSPPTDMFGLFCTIQGMGRYRCDRTSLLCRNLISTIDLIYIYEGCIEVQSGDHDRFTISAHEAFMAGGSYSYQLRCSGDKAADFLLLSHCGMISEKYYGLICHSRAMKLLLLSIDNFEDLLGNLAFYMKYPFQANQILSVHTLTQILMQIYLSSLDPEAYSTQGQPKWLQTSLEYMDNNYHKKIAVTDIADHCGLSASHLSKLFRENTGMSPYQYLMKSRIAKAKTFLKNGDMSVKYIAYAVGFPSINHFIANFRKDTGITPGSYRQQSKGIIRQN